MSSDGLVNNLRIRKGMLYSTRKKNPDGLSEKEEKARSLPLKEPTTRFRKRHLKELTEDEEEEIAKLYLHEFHAAKDIARQFKITPQLVGRIAKKAKNAGPAESNKTLQNLRRATTSQVIV